MDNQNEKDRTNVSSSFLNNRKKTKPVDHTLTEKLKNITDKNRIIQPVNPFSHFSDNNEVEQKEPSTIEKKVGGTAITALTGGLIHGKAAEETAGFVSKHKKAIFLSFGGLILLLLIAGIAIIAVLGSSPLGNVQINSYATSNITEDELVDQLMFYGFCSEKDKCKDSNSYRLAVKMQELHKQYAQPCMGLGGGYDPNNSIGCGVNLNTALIIETLNYYKREVEDVSRFEFDMPNDGGILAFFANLIENLVNAVMDLFGYQKLNFDVDYLARAQTEFVEQKCWTCEKDEETGQTFCHFVTTYFYQISSNKYVSYLLYGDTSSHPNYQGRPVVVYACDGPQDDMITTKYSEETNQTD